MSSAAMLNKFNQPSVVLYKHLKFLIMDSPSDINIEQYVKELARHGTTDIVRACEPHYAETVVQEAGIFCHDCEFKDGDPPPANIIDKWLDLIEKRCGTFDGKQGPVVDDGTTEGHKGGGADDKMTANPSSDPGGGNDTKEEYTALHAKATSASTSIQRCIAVHCVAGLGRAPMLVAVALMEAGFDAEDAVEHIRKARRGAINTRQFQFLLDYKSTRGGGSGGSCCVLQ
jgi:protein tyrosine phosphatase type 4A